MRTRHFCRLFLGVLFLVSLITHSGFTQEPSRFPNAKEIPSQDGTRSWRFETWLTSGKALIWRSSPAPLGTLLQLDTQTGEETALEAFDKMVRKTESYQDWLEVSPDGKKMLGYNPKGAVVITLDGHLLSTAPLGRYENFINRIAWLNNDEWVELVQEPQSRRYTHVKFHRVLGSQEPKAIPLNHPVDIIGTGGDFVVTPKGHLLLRYVQFGPQGEQELHITKATLHDLDLSTTPIQVRKVRLTMPEPFVTAMVVSPKGDHVTWAVTRKEINGKQQSLILSNIDGKRPRTIGYLNNEALRRVRGFEGLRWLPDGKHMSLGIYPSLWTFSAE